MNSSKSSDRSSGNSTFSRIIILLVSLIIVSVAGYMVIAELPFTDALYMTIITISTVGYGEVTDMDLPSRIFTMFIIFAGLGIVAYSFTTIAAFLVEGDFRKILRRRSMERRVERMTNHFIVCGAGQTGSSVIEQFSKAKKPFVIIEQDKAKCEELSQEGYTVVNGDATDEEILLEVNIEKADGLISCLETDADNVFTVLTARGINPSLHIVARAIEKSSHTKLKKAGANHTISPNEIGGTRMAFLMLRPNVVNFLESITRFDDQVLDIGEVTIRAGSDIAGSHLKDARIPEKTGLIVIAVKQPGKESMEFNPSSHTMLPEGTVMLVLGKLDKIQKLKQIAEDNE